MQWNGWKVVLGPIKRLKTYLRSTMREVRLTACDRIRLRLALLFVNDVHLCTKQRRIRLDWNSDNVSPFLFWINSILYSIMYTGWALISWPQTIIHNWRDLYVRLYNSSYKIPTWLYVCALARTQTKFFSFLPKGGWAPAGPPIDPPLLTLWQI